MPLDTFGLIEIMPDERKLRQLFSGKQNLSDLKFSASNQSDCFPLVVYDHHFPTFQDHFIRGMNVNSHALLTKAICSIIKNKIRQKQQNDKLSNQ